jgi:hypothetical protein
MHGAAKLRFAASSAHCVLGLAPGAKSCTNPPTWSKNGGKGRHHKQQHRLDEDETKSHVIGSRCRAGQWASLKATHNPASTGVAGHPLSSYLDASAFHSSFQPVMCSDHEVVVQDDPI